MRMDRLSLTFIKINDRQYIELFPEREANSDRLNHISIETDDAEGHAALPGREGSQECRTRSAKAGSAMRTSM